MVFWLTLPSPVESWLLTPQASPSLYYLSDYSSKAYEKDARGVLVVQSELDNIASTSYFFSWCGAFDTYHVNDTVSRSFSVDNYCAAASR